MKRFTHILLLSFMFTSLSTLGIDLKSVGLDSIKSSVLPSAPTQMNFFTGDDVSQKQKMLENLKAEYKTIVDKEKPFTESLDAQIQALKKDIDEAKTTLSQHPNEGEVSEFLSKKLTVFNKKYQTLPDLREVNKVISEYMKQHIEYLDKYFKSVGSTDYIEEKSLYTLADLQGITRKITVEKDSLSRLRLKKESEESIVSRTESVVSAKEKEAKSLNESLEILKKSSTDVKNQITILDIEKDALLLERDLSALRVEEHLLLINFIDSQIFVTNYKIDELQNDLTLVRSRMKVDKQDVFQYQQANDDMKKGVESHRIELIRRRTDLSSQKVQMQEEIDKLGNRYKVSLSNIAKIEDWDIVADSIREGFGAFSVSLAQTQLAVLDQKIEEIRVELFMEDAKLAHAQALEDSVKSLYAIMQAKFSDIDQLEKERAHYKDMKSTIQNMDKMYQENTTELHALMKSQYKKTANIKKDQEQFKSHSPKDIAENQKKYNEGLAVLSKALKLVDIQSDISLKSSEKYTALIDQKEETLMLANFMVQELDLIGVWHRSNRAVTIEGIKQIIPNLITFAQNVYGVITDYVINFHILTDLYDFVTTSTSQLLSYLLFAIFLYIIFLCLQAILPALYNGLMLIPEDIHGLFLLSRIFAVICGFLQKSLGSIFFWLLIFACLSFYQFSIAFTLIFYGCSIVFLTYLSRAFLTYLLTFNRSISFALLGESFEERFSWIFSFFSISTVSILFFRKMFMLAMMYQQSEFPIILLRLYHVVIFISVVFSIEKEELLNLIPKTNIYFQSLSKVVNNYYYLLSLFCILVLILSDPYLGGYGHLMWYMIFNVALSAMLFATMYLVHNSIKSLSSRLFFREYGEFGLKERFEYAKTWYATFIVILFFASVLFTLLLTAQIWGYPLDFGQIERLLNHNLISWSGIGAKIEHLRVMGLIRIVMSVFLGFFFAFSFRRYVLQRIFDLQYVDPGVQDMITTIARYVIIIGTVLIGFAREGLGSQVFYILVLGLVGFAFTFKDFFADMVAYFFILVQRPIKVGDFIKVDATIMGVVKKLSLRAVILRKRNSVTIVVPNSIILKSALFNWNYTRGFIAFDDITFSVSFEADPLEVKNVLREIVLNHSEVLKVPEPIIRLDAFGDNGYKFMIRGFISSGNTLNQWNIMSDIRISVISTFKEKGIELAEPILSVKNIS